MARKGGGYLGDWYRSKSLEVGQVRHDTSYLGAFCGRATPVLPGSICADLMTPRYHVIVADMNKQTSRHKDLFFV